MNLNDAQILAELHMEAHGLIAKGWRFQFDKSTRRFGFCRDDKVISLSATLVQLNPEREVEQTILHEVAHAIVGNKQHHNRIWRHKAIELGHSGNRCYTASAVVMPAQPAPWSQVCDTCGTRHPRYKKTNIVSSCGKCSRRFNPAYILRWEKNLND